MPEAIKIGRAFSDEKHASGQWRTHTVVSSNGCLRLLFRYLSFKRDGVDGLAADIAAAVPAGVHATVIDLGAGQGAYAHWFVGGLRRKKPAEVTIVAIDWSHKALARLPAGRCRIIKICADACCLPLKPSVADALYSLDTLGHVGSVQRALDEAVRVLKPCAPLFLHSECGDYRKRWPDIALIKKIGYDFLARFDDHRSIMPAATLRSLYAQRFHIDKFQSPAGLTGWLTGYPEKYRLAFAKANMRAPALLTSLLAIIKRLPIAGLLLRLCNSTLNHLELALGLEGGGSCFAHLHKPATGASSCGDARKTP